MVKAMLAECTQRLLRLEFPNFPEDDLLSDWLAELAEMDGHVAGPAKSSRSFGRDKTIELREDLRKCRSRLDTIQVSLVEDQSIYIACKEYVAVLIQVADSLED